jgi:hypothetical protein
MGGSDGHSTNHSEHVVFLISSLAALVYNFQDLKIPIQVIKSLNILILKNTHIEDKRDDIASRLDNHCFLTASNFILLIISKSNRDAFQIQRLSIFPRQMISISNI